MHLIGSSFTCSEREHADDADDAEETDAEADAEAAATATAASSLGGLHVVAALQRLAPPSPLGCRSGLPCLLLLLLLLLSSLSSLFLLTVSLANLALWAKMLTSAIDCLWRSKDSSEASDRSLAPRPFL